MLSLSPSTSRPLDLFRSFFLSFILSWVPKAIIQTLQHVIRINPVVRELAPDYLEHRKDALHDMGSLADVVSALSFETQDPSIQEAFEVGRSLSLYLPFPLSNASFLSSLGSLICFLVFFFLFFFFFFLTEWVRSACTSIGHERFLAP